MSSDGITKRSKEARQHSDDADSYNKEKRAGPRQHKKGLKSLLVAVTLPLLAGSIDALFNNANQPFYKELKKPSWNPPGWLFGLAWSILYPTMGLASWLVWVEGGWKKQAHPLGLYVLQLVLNLLWPVIFFGQHNLALALVDIGVLDVVLVVCIGAFKPVNHVASNLLKPYLAWVLFATALNYTLWKMNS